MIAGLSGVVRRWRGIILSYLFFGVCTTLVNIMSYGVLYYWFNVGNVASVMVAWIIAVSFAFFTNKFLVFESRQVERMRWELPLFFFFRGVTGAVDLLVMYVSVDCLMFHPLFWKVVSNFVVIILNFLFSKLFVFKRRGDDAEENG